MIPHLEISCGARAVLFSQRLALDPISLLRASYLGLIRLIVVNNKLYPGRFRYVATTHGLNQRCHRN